MIDPPPATRPGHEGRVLLLALLGPLPAVVVALALLWTGRSQPQGALDPGAAGA